MKIQWLKLDVEIFNNAKIKKLRRMAGGNEYFVLWVGLLTLGMKCAKYGVLEISDGLPYTPEDFSEEFDLTVETVKQGLELFERLNMIKAVDGGTVEICDFRKHQSITRIEQVRELAKARQVRHREKLQLAHNIKILELDRDRDKDKEDTRYKRVTEVYNEWKSAIIAHYSTLYKNIHGVEYSFDIGDWSMLAKRKDTPAAAFCAVIDAWFKDSWGKTTGHGWKKMLENDTFNRLRSIKQTSKEPTRQEIGSTPI